MRTKRVWTTAGIAGAATLALVSVRAQRHVALALKVLFPDDKRIEGGSLAALTARFWVTGGVDWLNSVADASAAAVTIDNSRLFMARIVAPAKAVPRRLTTLQSLATVQKNVVTRRP